MGKKSRDKGARGERELAAELTRLFDISARRGQQFKGSPDSPDVVAIDGIHIECKRMERFNLYSALEQSKDDSGKNIPVVMHRRNRKKWVVIAYLDDLPELCEVINDYTK